MLALPPLSAETIFHIGSFPVTNAFINSTLVLLLFLVAGLFLRKSHPGAPKGFQNFAESVMEFLFKYFDQVTGSREKTLRFLPIVGSLFFFILISNWIGVFPGIGSIGVWENIHGRTELVPIFRSANTDLNLTLAMAVLGVAFSHILGVFTIGFFRYANKFIKLGDIWKAVKSGKVMNIMTAVIEFFVGLIEIVSEVAKVVSLSLRLFGNIFAGEVLLTVIGGLIAYFAPLPFQFLELLVGIVQAAVFAMLVLVYLAVSTMPIHATEH